MSLRTTLPPVESPQARTAIVTAYKALKVLDEAGLLDFIAENTYDIMAADRARAALGKMEEGMSPNLLLTILPAYTHVRFQTDRSRQDEYLEGQTREGAWGLYPDERGESSTQRRLTMRSGFEFFVDPTTVFTSFEITERPAVKR